MQILFYVMLAIVGQAQVTDKKADYDQDESLRGIGKFIVGVESLKPESPVTSEQIKTDVELRLRSLGIPISQEKIDPILFVTVGISPRKIYGEIVDYAFFVSVSFHQIALLNHGTRTVVEIWSVSGLGWVGVDNAKEFIRKGVRDKIDDFANAWLKTHPKEPEKKSDTPKP